MSFYKLIVRLVLLSCLLCVGRTAMAGPAHCAYGSQDSTCVGKVSAGWQAAPTCSAAAGWTTIAAATWIGSQYTAPQCNYQAPPTCGTGYTETAAPTWNGSSWSAPGCQADAEIPPPPSPSTACTALASSYGYTVVAPWVFQPALGNPNAATGEYYYVSATSTDIMKDGCNGVEDLGNGVACGVNSSNQALDIAPTEAYGACSWH